MKVVSFPRTNDLVRIALAARDLLRNAVNAATSFGQDVARDADNFSIAKQLLQ